MRYNNVLETIGNTPLIKLPNIAKNIPGVVYGKVESYNPGQSAKDRIALYMVEQAEKKRLIKPGDTIIEATSGNTGFSLSLVCSLKGYNCLLTVSSKASKEKIDLLRAMGAEVIVCPSEVNADDPRSYYSQALRYSQEIANSYYINQNYNLDNSQAHYNTTGPEIWEQTKGKITHFVCCAGTGGTLSGTAQYLKEQNPDIKIIGVDACGSVLKKYYETGYFDESEIHPYRIEGLGKTIIPDNVNFSLIDEFIKVSDKMGAIRARQLVRQEGLFIGYSSGAAMQAVFKLKDSLTKNAFVVALFSDHGSRYLNKIYSDQWMREQGFLNGATHAPRTESIGLPKKS